MVKKKRKIAVLSFVVLNDIFSGQQKRIFDLIIGMSEDFEVHYFEITDQDTINSNKNLSDTGVHYHNYALGYNLIFKGVVNFLYFFLFPFFGIKKSLILVKIWSFLNQNKLKKMDFEVMIVEYFMCAFVFRYIDSRTTKIIDMHDIQFITLESLLINSKTFFKKSKIYFSRVIELKTLKIADGLISVNTNEIEMLKKLGVKSNFFFVPLSVDDGEIYRNTVKRDFAVINLAYFAGLSTQRSYEELYFILNDLLDPVFKGNDLVIKLYVYGNNATQQIIELCNKYANVTFVGRLTNIRDGFTDIHFALNFWLGMSYGFRTRVLDVLSCGVPILTNEKCVEGMGLGSKCGVVFIEDSSSIVAMLNFYRAHFEEYNNLCDDAIRTAKLYARSEVSAKFIRELNNFLVLPKSL